MAKITKATIEAKGIEIAVQTTSSREDYFSLTDIARFQNPEAPASVINHWMRSHNTIKYLGLWEELHNLDFIPDEFNRFLNESGYNAFTLSPQKWISKTNAVGIVSKSGRYGGTFAHSDIALKFAASNLNCISSRIINALKMMKDAVYNWNGMPSANYQKQTTGFTPMQLKLT